MQKWFMLALAVAAAVILSRSPGCRDARMSVADEVGPAPTGSGQDWDHDRVLPPPRESDTGLIRQQYRIDAAPLDPLGKTLEDSGESGVIPLTGTVHAKGGPVGNALVYLQLASQKSIGGRSGVDIVSRERLPLPWATTRTNSDGEFAFQVPIRASTYPVDVGTWVAGYLPALREGVLVNQDEPAVVDFHLETGAGISGLLFEQDGRPAVGALVLATQDQRFGGDSIMISTAFLQRDRERTAGRFRPFDEGEARTDDHGHFEIWGLSPGRYLLVSGEATRIWTPTAAHTGERGVILQATAAPLFRLEAVDAASEVPLDRFSVQLDVPTRVRSGAPAANTQRIGSGVAGRCDMTWMEWPGVELVGELQWTVSADGYESQRGSAPIGFEASDVVVVALRPTEPFELRIHARFRSGAGVDGDLVVRYAAPGGISRGRTIAKAQADGVHRCELPKGRWLLEVSRATDVSRFSAWRGEFVAAITAAPLPVHLDVVLEAGAEIHMELPASLASSVDTWSVLVRADGFAGAYSFSGAVGKLTGLGPGTWRLAIDAQPIGRWDREVSIQGTESVHLSLY